MTGFGDAAEQAEGVHFAVELRSLNNRFFKATLRLPERLAGLEAELEAQLRRRLGRGSITLVVAMREGGAQAAQQVNDAALLVYLDHLESIHRKMRAQERAVTIDLTALLALPGVLVPADAQEMLRRARGVVSRLVDRACDKMTAMRVAEGQAIALDLAEHRRQIAQRLGEIAARAPVVVEEYHQRLRGRIDELLRRAELSVVQVDLIREVAIFADRSDISEEVSRLTGHLEQFEQLTAGQSKEPVGRTLEFLVQEMLREANTISSKSNDAAISRRIVEVKGAIDRMKEQVQNVE